MATHRAQQQVLRDDHDHLVDIHRKKPDGKAPYIYFYIFELCFLRVLTLQVQALFCYKVHQLACRTKGAKL